MKRQSEKYRLGILAELNITPLLDLAFVLLIIFVITSPFLAESVAIEVSTAGPNPQSDDPSHVFTVDVDVTGDLALDGESIGSDELGTSLAARRHAFTGDKFGKVGVLVRPHRDLPVHDLLDVIEEIKLSGINRVALAAREHPNKPPTVATTL